MRVRPLHCLVESARVLVSHPGRSLALGAAMVVSVGAVCCGLGLVAVPWFGCELYAFQIRAATGVRPARTRAWLSAGAFVLGGTLIVMAASAVAALGLGSSPVDLTEPSSSARSPILDFSVSALGTTLALLFVMPFTYAPRILVDRGGTLGAAALESVRFFVRHGLARHVGLALLSHAVQTAPLTLATLITLSVADETAVPLATLFALPLLVATVPLGQGVVTAAWVERRDLLVDAARVPSEGRAPRALAVALVALLLAPPIALVGMLTSVARPSRMDAGHLPADVPVLVDVGASSLPRSVVLPDTALTLEIDETSVSIVASDGGGAGRLELGSHAPVERVRAARVRDAFGVEVTSGGTSYLTWVDRAGVRLDDDLAARLADHVPLWGRIAMALVLLVTPLLATFAVLSVAELRHRSATGEQEGLARERRRALAIAWAAFVLLAPLVVTALAAAVTAVIGT